MSMPKFHKALSLTLTRLISTTTRIANLKSGTKILETPALNSKGFKRVEVNACGSISKGCQRTLLPRFSPNHRGINFNIEYYDSNGALEPAPGTRPPVVCMLHGAPGHYTDYSSLIDYLTKKNIRVIAPNFPDYTATLKHSFRHSPQERTDILLKFFQKLNVGQVDMLIGHSSAVYTMLELLNSSRVDESISIKSLGFFSTPTYNLPPNLAVTPLRLYVLKLFALKSIRPVLMSVIEKFVELQGIRNRVDKNKIEDLLIAASAIGYADSDKTADYLKLIHQLRIPSFLLYGCNDRLIPVECFTQLKGDLGIVSDLQIKRYGEDGQLDVDAETINELVEVSEFKSGGHYVFQKFADQVNEDVYLFLKRKVLNRVEPNKR